MPGEPTTLRDLAVLAVDCQATGASPKHGSLLELGWAASQAARPSPLAEDQVTAHLIALPAGRRIPRPVSRLTGLTAADLSGAIAAGEAWQQLCRAAGEVAAQSRRALAATVIHFARFEQPFLQQLHAEHGAAAQPFPLELICTHDIARRLLPELPRRGLRAVAGYFGFSAQLLRRSASHVAATSFLWTHLIELLAAEHGVLTLAELRRWLREPVPRARRVYPMARDRRLGLPDEPGVYRLLRANEDVLYVGKADSLRKRVNSYFQKRRGQGERLLEMLSQVREVAVTETATCLEAALLEVDVIKRAEPLYNKALRKEDRSVWFCSSALGEGRPRPDDTFHIGPLPSKIALRSLGALGRLVEGSERGEVDPQKLPDHWRAACLGVPASFAPEPRCFAAGYRQLLAQHLGSAGRPTWLRLLALGSRLWRAELQAGGDEPAAAGAAAEQRRDWDPERVLAELLDGVRDAARLVRRSRWLCRLSESVVAWREPAMAPGVRRVLTIAGGRIVSRAFAAEAEPLPAPPGAQRRHRERQRGFDIASYDRLRVLTTELRRLGLAVAGSELRLGPQQHTLRDQRLRQALAWV